LRDLTFGAKPASAGFVVSGQEITLDLRGSSTSNPLKFQKQKNHLTGGFLVKKEISGLNLLKF
jgi:hypothetical protein